MRIGDLKRAVEDVILRPDDNRLSDITKRSTIAALDLCQRSQDVSALGVVADGGRTDASFSCSGEMLSSPTGSTCSTSITTSSGPTHSELPLSMSTSLDTMVLRQSLSCRPSLGASRRSSRVLPHYVHSKRKRSNSVSSCNNKGMLDDRGALSSMGVGCLCVGGSSALSLPPTARHTPLRFGDSEDRPTATPSAATIEAIASMSRSIALNHTSISDSLDRSLCASGALMSMNGQWSQTPVHLDCDSASEDGALSRHEISLAGSGEEGAMQRTLSSTDANYSARSAFGSFRIAQSVFCDSDDNDERMDCD